MRLRIAVFALAALGGVALSSTSGSAMPNGLSTPDQIAGQTSNVQEARWICPPADDASGVPATGAVLLA
jgi:hypothetical protein